VWLLPVDDQLLPYYPIHLRKNESLVFSVSRQERPPGSPGCHVSTPGTGYAACRPAVRITSHKYYLQTVVISVPLLLGLNQLCGPRSSFLTTNVSFSDNQ